MKITDDMLTEMEPIVSQWIRERGTCMDCASYAAALELAAYVAALRTTLIRETWISIDEKLPTCNRKAGSLGVEVLIYPAMETGERTAFFGRRISQKPTFYRYGAPVHGVTHWMPLPDAPADAARAQGGELC
ncbi:DUF551 domain-containing protein [Burkholderia cepacia]|uniref:DUF551 domain-containing protein n=1 Tax=Burkholderia cepacia TaxID=292 RepID=UPI001CF5081D|nr:DUF551 domain-containing protein [Burkholderia cepacia]MCA8113861.1 DUF551 domain-containing protein [Burkholderia cepacia]MCA8400623.1 DUF551 domain-containing protein [Burkholderia cepacia]